MLVKVSIFKFCYNQDIAAMSCGANRCALRRFDGHGSSSYRPLNSEATTVFNTSVQAMMAERARQDSGIFSSPIPIVQPVQQPMSQPPIIQQNPSTQSTQSTQPFYSLSDSTMKS